MTKPTLIFLRDYSFSPDVARVKGGGLISASLKQLCGIVNNRLGLEDIRPGIRSLFCLFYLSILPMLRRQSRPGGDSLPLPIVVYQPYRYGTTTAEMRNDTNIGALSNLTSNRVRLNNSSNSCIAYRHITIAKGYNTIANDLLR